MRRALPLLLLALLGCRRQPTHARIDAAIAPLLPPDTLAVAGLRLDRARQAGFPLDPTRVTALAEFQANTGIDPAQSVWEVVWSWRPGHTLAFVRGKFGGEFGLEPRLDAPGTTRQNYKGYYVLDRAGRGVLFIHSGVAIVGAVEDLRAVVDSRDRPGAVPPLALIEMVEKLPSCHFYAVAGPGLPVAPAPLTARLWGDFGSAVTLRAELGFPDAAAARAALGWARPLLEVSPDGARLLAKAQGDPAWLAARAGAISSALEWRRPD
jgi:hypothetical protein